MEKEETHALLLSQAINYLWDSGTYLNKRQNENFIMKLYFADEKYFELYHLKQNEETIVKIREVSLEELIVSYRGNPLVEEKLTINNNY
jgi:hypothetical protein